jgi:hypothetical protein
MRDILMTSLLSRAASRLYGLVGVILIGSNHGA